MADTIDADTPIERARAMVASDPAVLGGIPVIRGTRVPVHDVAASVAAGFSRERILAAYPHLTAEQIELAVVYASVEPQVEYPQRISDQALPPGARIVYRRRVRLPRP